MTTPTGPTTVTRANAASFGDFGDFKKRGSTRISLFTMPPGTTYQTPEGLRAEDEDTRIAFDVQGGVYPIRESVFRQSYIESEARATASLDVEALRAAVEVAFVEARAWQPHPAHSSWNVPYWPFDEFTAVTAREYARLAAEGEQK